MYILYPHLQHSNPVIRILIKHIMLTNILEGAKFCLIKAIQSVSFQRLLIANSKII